MQSDLLWQLLHQVLINVSCDLYMQELRFRSSFAKYALFESPPKFFSHYFDLCNFKPHGNVPGVPPS